MENVLNYNQDKHFDYSVEQLQLPLQTLFLIDKTDTMRSFLKVIKEVNLNK